jgi:hypothetical protein
MKFKKKDYLFLAIILVVQIVFYLMAYHFKKIYWGDSGEYIQEAVNIKDHFFFYCGNLALPISEEYMTMRPPLYPLFLSLVYLFVVSNWVVLAIQNIISIISIMLVRDTIIQLGFNEKYDWLLLFLVIMYPAQFIFSNVVYSDILLQAFVVIYFRNFVLFVLKKKWKYALWMSLALIGGAMVKPVFYPFTIVHVVILLVMAFILKAKLIRVLSIALLPVLVFLLYSSWNNGRTGKFHFSSMEAINADYNCFEYNKYQLGAIKANQLYDDQRNYIATLKPYKARYDTSIKIAKQFIAARLPGYALFHLVHTCRSLIEPGKNEIDVFIGDFSLINPNLEKTINNGFYATLRVKGWRGMGEYIRRNNSMPAVILIVIFNCVRLLGFILFVCSRRILFAVRALAFILVAYFATTVGPVACTHYFLPVSLIMAGCAVLSIQLFLEKRKNSVKTNF